MRANDRSLPYVPRTHSNQPPLATLSLLLLHRYEQKPSIIHHPRKLPDTPIPFALLSHPSYPRRATVPLSHWGHLALHSVLDHHLLRGLPSGCQRICRRRAVAELEGHVAGPCAVYVGCRRRGASGRECGRADVRLIFLFWGGRGVVLGLGGVLLCACLKGLISFDCFVWLFAEGWGAHVYFVSIRVGAIYSSGSFRMSTWIPFVWALINVLVLIVSSFSIQGGLWAVVAVPAWLPLTYVEEAAWCNPSTCCWPVILWVFLLFCSLHQTLHIKLSFTLLRLIRGAETANRHGEISLKPSHHLVDELACY